MFIGFCWFRHHEFVVPGKSPQEFLNPLWWLLWFLLIFCAYNKTVFLLIEKYILTQNLLILKNLFSFLVANCISRQRRRSASIKTIHRLDHSQHCGEPSSTAGNKIIYVLLDILKYESNFNDLDPYIMALNFNLFVTSLFCKTQFYLSKPFFEMFLLLKFVSLGRCTYYLINWRETFSIICKEFSKLIQNFYVKWSQ